MQPNPSSLLDRLREPDADQAWDRFVDLYAPMLFSWARQKGLAEPEATELVQDVILSLIQKLPEFEEDSQQGFRRWLQTLLGDEHRRWAGHRGTKVAEADFNQVDHEEYQRQLATRALQMMQTEFEPTTWRACWENVVFGRPASKVAAELGLTEAAVYSAGARVLHRLRQELAGLLE
jgi:RNA polymerase sigma-70 factor (ECF subfamily)